MAVCRYILRAVHLLARLLSGSTVLRNAIDGGYIAPFGGTSPWTVSTANTGIWLVLATFGLLCRLVHSRGVHAGSIAVYTLQFVIPNSLFPIRWSLWCHLGLHLSGVGYRCYVSSRIGWFPAWCAPCCAMRRESSSTWAFFSDHVSLSYTTTGNTLSLCSVTISRCRTSRLATRYHCVQWPCLAVVHSDWQHVLIVHILFIPEMAFLLSLMLARAWCLCITHNTKHAYR